MEFGIKFGARKGLWRSEHYVAARIFGRAKDAGHLALLHNFILPSIPISGIVRQGFRLTKLLPICNDGPPLKNHILRHKSMSPALDCAAGLITGLSPAASGLDKGLIPLSGPLSPL
ncbi:hypothetical protein ACVIRM_001034 [Rhizobium laguerreae]